MTDALFEEVLALIEEGRTAAAVQSNAAQIITYWSVGCAIENDILKQERAPYGQQIMVTLADRLTACYGRTYHHRNLRRMVQFSKWSVHFFGNTPVLHGRDGEGRLPQVIDDEALQSFTGVMARLAFGVLGGLSGFAWPCSGFAGALRVRW
ncbi:MAG: DUF1016 N-terminal domain-containing protein [Propionibacteriaceae bacterium]|jgi:hypothetical protein|nr:DUF1016 N-terminal domain-containing protein [Propionibacteriaceae bacterium]